MAFPRFGLALAPLDAARVVVAGGMAPREAIDEDANPEGWESVQSAAQAATEVLEIDVMRFSVGPPLSCGRCGCCALALEEGRVLVLGGLDGFEGLRSTELLEAVAAPAPAPVLEGVAVGWGPRHAPRQAGCEYQGVGHMEPWEAVCNTPRLNARRAQRARVATLA